LHFTHSLTTDIFNFSPNDATRDGNIVGGCMVVNLFDSRPDQSLINNDAEVFSGLFSNREVFFIAGEKHEAAVKKYGYQNVRSNHYSIFVTEMKRRIKETENISAFGKSKLFYFRLKFNL
jgi:hypothetical protein